MKHHTFHEGEKRAKKKISKKKIFPLTQDFLCRALKFLKKNIIF